MDIVIILLYFILFFITVFINRKTAFKQGILQVLKYLITCNKEEYEEFIKEINKLRKEMGEV